jgi:TRAP-type mannitol/chloroaromatic compound transport system substrate-binding protein
MLAVFEKGWNEVVAEETAKNPNFKKVYDSYSVFRAEYAAWKDVGYLK